MYFQRIHHGVILHGMNGSVSGFINGVPFTFDDSEMDDYEVHTCVLFLLLQFKAWLGTLWPASYMRSVCVAHKRSHTAPVMCMVLGILK